MLNHRGPIADQELDSLGILLRQQGGIGFLVLQNLEPGDTVEDWAYLTRRIASYARGIRPGISIGVSDVGPRASETIPLLRELAGRPDVMAYIDAFVFSPLDAHSSQLLWNLPEDKQKTLAMIVRESSPETRTWIQVDPSAFAGAERARHDISQLINVLGDSDEAADLFIVVTPDLRGIASPLARVCGYLNENTSRSPSPPEYADAEGRAIGRLPRFFDAKTLTPVWLISSELPGEGGRYFIGGYGGYATDFKAAEVQELMTGERRVISLPLKSRTLHLDTEGAPLAVRLIPAEKPGEVQAAVTVGGEHHLTAEEIVARERAWKAAQDDHVRSYTADLVTSLRFRIAEVNETFDLTILGPLLKERGKDFDWAWEQFYVNGIKWKGKTLPKIPILQPEKVTTLPLEIELTEQYAYTLAGRGQAEGHDCYEIDFAPKEALSEKPAYRGRAWIDAKTFALVKRRSVQEHLKGETLSNIETEFYRPVPGDPQAVLPLEIKGEEVFSTAGRTTAIERSVVFKNVKINPPDLEERRRDLYASEKQIVRDTDRGLKYLVPDPQRPGARIVEEQASKKSLFGAGGFFYDGSVSYPIPLLGVQYFDFDLFGKGKQISTFFGGVLLTSNYTDPALAGSRFDAGADLFAVAIPFGDVSYRNGKEVKSERLKHVPAVFQVNLGHPLGPYLKGSVSVFAKYDGYQRDSDTASDFVTPADTETYGVTGKLTANVEGFNATVDYSRFHRADWPFWGEPGTSEYKPSQRDYEKWSVSLSKDYYFSHFRKLHAGIRYLDGSDLDRFSRYEFGAFSGNPLRGYKSGALRTSQAMLMNLSYGLNIEDIIRFEVLYDQAIINDRVSGFRRQYFSGAGLSGQLNGPWNNSLIRFDVGVPAVSHGIHGFSATALILKLF